MEKTNEIKKKLLIVDDDKFMRHILLDMLSEDGRYEMFTASNGVRALEKVESHCPEIVLLDYSMPDMSGLEVLRAIKRLYPKIIVIIVTAEDNEKIALKLMLEGASDYISKSSNLDELHYKIDKAMIICEREFRIDQLENTFSDMVAKSKDILEEWKSLKESCLPSLECEKKLSLFDEHFNTFLANIREHDI